MARCAAKNSAGSGLAHECLLPLVYCIGVVDCVSVTANTFGSGRLSDVALVKLVRKVFPLVPRGMIEHLGLCCPRDLEIAVYGLLGRAEFTWARLDAADELRAKAAQRQ
jgi:S-adenosylmethionine synthetase